MPTQKAKLYKNLYINQISQTNFKSFSNQRSDTSSTLNSLNSSLPFFFFLHLFLFTWNIFLCLAICLSHIWLDIKDRDVHLKTLRGHSNTQRRSKAFGEYLGTWTLGDHSQGTRALGGHSGTWGTRALGQLGI